MPGPVASGNHSYVFAFGARTDGGAEMRELLGGKGANLAELAKIGLPVPPGFTLSSSFCRSYYDGGREMPAGLREELHDGLQRIEKVTGLQLGEGAGELRLAVRSGAAVSMPGMMDTVLGLGTRDAVEEAVLRVFDSWSSERARTYRSERGIIGLDGTAVTVQACLLYTSPSPRDLSTSRMPSSA